MAYYDADIEIVEDKLSYKKVDINGVYIGKKDFEFASSPAYLVMLYFLNTIILNTVLPTNTIFSNLSPPLVWHGETLQQLLG